MPLLSLANEMLTHILTLVVLMKDICHAARSCQRLLAAAEQASKARLMSGNSCQLYVPLERSYGGGTQFTWRTRLALSFREAFQAADKLSWLGAGLVIYGPSFFQNECASDIAERMTDVLNQKITGNEGSHERERWDSHEDSITYISLSRGELWTRQKAVDVRQLTHFTPRRVSESDSPNALVVSIRNEALAAAPEAYDTLMDGIIYSDASQEILDRPLYIPTDVWMAMALSGRPALPDEGPLVAVRTVAERDAYLSLETAHHVEPHLAGPQTTIELRDRSRRVLGRAKLRYRMDLVINQITPRSGPTLKSFKIFSAATNDATLVAAAALVDEARPETSTALAAAASRSAADARLLAARVLLWCGIEAYLGSLIDPTLPYVYPLRAAPELWRDGPFLAWRGMKERSAGSPLDRLDFLPGSMHWQWPRMALGNGEEDWWQTEAMGDEEGDDGDVEPPLPAAELQAAREVAAERLGGEVYTEPHLMNQDDADSEYEFEHLPRCGCW